MMFNNDLNNPLSESPPVAVGLSARSIRYPITWQLFRLVVEPSRFSIARLHAVNLILGHFNVNGGQGQLRQNLEQKAHDRVLSE